VLLGLRDGDGLVEGVELRTWVCDFVVDSAAVYASVTVRVVELDWVTLGLRDDDGLTVGVGAPPTHTTTRQRTSSRMTRTAGSG